MRFAIGLVGGFLIGSWWVRKMTPSVFVQRTNNQVLEYLKNDNTWTTDLQAAALFAELAGATITRGLSRANDGYTYSTTTPNQLLHNGGI